MTDTIHPAAARGFDAGADAYERARPELPARRRRRRSSSGSTCGRGARSSSSAPGTGKLTRLLVPSGARIVALEPVAGDAGEAGDGDRGADAVEIVDGTAEAIPLPAGSVDAVVVAQAFHWFDAIRALSEIHRVLRPGGTPAAGLEPARRVGALGPRAGRPDPHPRRRRAAGLGRRLAGVARAVRAVRSRGTAPRSAMPRCSRARACSTASASVSFVAAAEPSAQAEVLADVEAMLRDDPDTAGRDDDRAALRHRGDVGGRGARSSRASPASSRRST